MSVLEDRAALLADLTLDTGSHQSWENGACVMEAVAYVAGEPWTDHPKCASRVLTNLLIGLNDRWNDEDRQLLKPYITRLVGTNTGDADEQRRKFMIRDWLVHEYAPAVFRAANLTALAEQFEALVSITDSASWEDARVVIYKVRDEAWERRRAAVAAAVADAVAAAAAAAAADAVAAAAAAAVADADAAAVAAAAADAVAVAVADAVADADADADAVAAADAVADAVAAAAAAAAAYKQVLAAAVKAAAAEKAKGNGYWPQRDAAYLVFKPYYREVWRERFVGLGLRESVLQLVDRLIDLTPTTEGSTTA